MPDVTGMMMVNFIAPLVPSQFDLTGVDDNDIIAGVHVRGENGFGLAADNRRRFAGNPAYCLVRRIDHDPFFNDILRFS